MINPGDGRPGTEEAYNMNMIVRNSRIGLACVLVGMTPASLTLGAQTAFNGQITPGVNLRSDVDKALGAPVKQVSAALFEYKPQNGASQLQVAFRANGVVDYINAGFGQVYSRDALVKALSLPSPAQPTKIAQGHLAEFFSAPAFLVFIYASAQANSGVAGLVYESPERFASDAPGAPQSASTNTSPPVNGPPPALPPPAGQPYRDPRQTTILPWPPPPSADQIPLTSIPPGGVDGLTFDGRILHVTVGSPNAVDL